MVQSRTALCPMEGTKVVAGRVSAGVIMLPPGFWVPDVCAP